jgi:hypothetical protein
MRSLIASLCLLVAVQSWSAVGVDVSSTTDSVMKVVYTGSSPAGPQPVLSVSGKKIGVRSVAKDTSYARGLAGIVQNSSDSIVPDNLTPVNSSIGVLGTGYVGVAGIANYPNLTGVYGQGYYGIHGLGRTAGVVGEARDGYGTYGGQFRGHGGSYVWGVEVSGDSAGQAIGTSTYANSSGGSSYGIVAGATNGYENWAGWFDGDIYVSGAVNPSDEMFKKNVAPLSGSLTKVMALQPKRYDMKTDEFKGRINLPKGEQFGLLAQDVQAVFPQLVRDATAPVRLTKEEREARVKKDGLKFKSVNYNALIPVLIAAMQEQEAKIEALEAALAATKK